MIVLCYILIGIFAFVGRHPLDVTHTCLFWAMIVQGLGVVYALSKKPTWRRRLAAATQLWVVGSLAIEPLGAELIVLNGVFVLLIIGGYAFAQWNNMLERLAPPPG